MYVIRTNVLQETCMCVHVVACIPGANDSSVTSTQRQNTDLVNLINICNK